MHKHLNDLCTTTWVLNIIKSWTIKKKQKNNKTCHPHVLIWQSSQCKTDWQQIWNTISHSNASAHEHTLTHTPSVWVGLPLEQTHSVKQSSVVYSLITSCCWLASQTEKGYPGTILSQSQLFCVFVYVSVFVHLMCVVSAYSKHVQIPACIQMFGYIIQIR